MRVTDGDDHYAVLGVARDSTPEQIRDAYRAMARRLHPDHAPGDTAAAQMARVNEAYYVLRDVGRRAVYDAGRPQASSSAAGGATPYQGPVNRPSRPVTPAPSHQPETARFPWRWVLAFGIVGSVAVGTLSVLVEPAEEPKPDNLMTVGSCVRIEANGDAREVACTDGDDLVVTHIVSFDETCPYGTDAHRDRQGLGIACVSRSSADETDE